MNYGKELRRILPTSLLPIRRCRKWWVTPPQPPLLQEVTNPTIISTTMPMPNNNNSKCNYKYNKLFKDESEEIWKSQPSNDEYCERNRILLTTQKDTFILQDKLRSANAKICQLRHPCPGTNCSSINRNSSLMSTIRTWFKGCATWPARARPSSDANSSSSRWKTSPPMTSSEEMLSVYKSALVPEEIGRRQKKPEHSQQLRRTIGARNASAVTRNNGAMAVKIISVSIPLGTYYLKSNGRVFDGVTKI